MPTSWHVQRVRLGLNQFAALRSLLWLEKYNTYSLNFWTKLMVKSCSYWPDLWLSLQRIPMLGDLTHTQEREFRRDCKIVRMHECGLYFSTRKPVDYQQRVGPLRTRRKGYRHLARENADLTFQLFWRNKQARWWRPACVDRSTRQEGWELPTTNTTENCHNWFN